jgi:hypothetical protein
MIWGHPAGLVENPTSAIRILVSGWSVLWVGLRFAVESLPKGIVLGRCLGVPTVPITAEQRSAGGQTFCE